MRSVLATTAIAAVEVSGRGEYQQHTGGGSCSCCFEVEVVVVMLPI